jgi:hypothetical protein
MSDARVGLIGFGLAGATFHAPLIAATPTPNSIRGASLDLYTIMVHTDVMATNEKAVRQSVTLPAKVAKQVRSMAKRRRLSANRMLVELLEEGIELQKQKEKVFFEVAERFRAATDPNEIARLGDQLGKMIFSK